MTWLQYLKWPLQKERHTGSLIIQLWVTDPWRSLAPKTRQIASLCWGGRSQLTVKPPCCYSLLGHTSVTLFVDGRASHRWRRTTQRKRLQISRTRSDGGTQCGAHVCDISHNVFIDWQQMCWLAFCLPDEQNLGKKKTAHLQHSKVFASFNIHMTV